MKLHALALSLSLLFFSYTTQAQYESVFGANQTSWNVFYSEMAGSFTDSLVVCCDTTINNALYKKVEHYRYFNNGNSQMLLQGATYLREDTVQGRVWSLDADNMISERLIVDLSFSIGDSFEILPGQYFYVDSIYTLNNRKHVRFDGPYYATYTEPFTMIEGVGTNIGLSDYYWILSSNSTYLLCAYKDNVVSYLNTHPLYGGQCVYFQTGMAKILLEDKVKSYPNPFSESITLEYEEGEYSERATITIYNVNGQKVMNERWASGQSKTIATTALPVGFYFMLLQETNGQLLHYAKLVKQ